jgi:hypothetical protein
MRDTPRSTRRVVVAAFVALVLCCTAGCAESTKTYRTSGTSTTTSTTARSTAPAPSTSTAVTAPAPTPLATTAPSAPAGAGDAAAVLAALPVAALNLAVPYDRTQDFGPAWADVDHNGCDTRNDILHRDLTGVEVRPGTHDCVVVAGTLQDPYTGTAMPFLKAQASRVQIDHIVPLHAAWMLGAYSWPYAQRVAFANDPANLLAVDAHNNESKGDSLADTWLPPNQAEWCDYARRTVAVHAAYHLPVTSAEKAALGRLLGTCPGAAQLPLPAPSPAPGGAAPAPAPAPTAAPSGGGSAGGGSVYYANCAAVRAAGKAPLYRGEPGYRAGLDRDDDGVACE